MEVQQAGPSRRAQNRITKLRPPPPALQTTDARPATTLPIKILQGAGIRRNNGRPGYPRNVIFVTRKTGLGSLLGRARGLILDEGYTSLSIYALSAAIPHALLLLHALLDILPYPSGPNGMWYEIKTDSVGCVDEVEMTAAAEDADGVEGDEFPGLGALEASAPVLRERMKSSVCIEVHVEPKTSPSVQEQVRDDAGGSKKRKSEGRKARPTARKRRARAMAGTGQEAGKGDDEEGMMNA